MYLWKSWTVRLYNILLRNQFTVTNAAEAIAIGDKCTTGMVRNGGKKCAVELYRAAGLGAYQIHKRLGYQMPFDRIKYLCERFDISLHERLD